MKTNQTEASLPAGAHIHAPWKVIEWTPGDWWIVAVTGRDGSYSPILELPKGSAANIIAGHAELASLKAHAGAHADAMAAALESALESALPALIRLGDFVGNVDEGGPSNQGRIDRCAIITEARSALAAFRGRS